MRVISLSCDHCGGPLDVPLRAKYVTCGFCDTRLAVESTGHTHFTRQLEQIDRTTREIAQDVKDIKRQLNELDDQWRGSQQRYQIRSRPELRRVPVPYEAVGFGAVGIVISVLVFGVFATLAEPAGMLVGLVLGLGSVLVLGIYLQKCGRYKRSRLKYEVDRRKLMKQMYEVYDETGPDSSL